MTNWRKKVDIKAILEDEEMDEVEQARRILSVLRKHEEFVEHDDGLLLEEMEDAIEELAETGDNKWFNAVLGGVYDVADSELIWMGP